MSENTNQPMTAEDVKEMRIRQKDRGSGQGLFSDKVLRPLIMTGCQFLRGV